MTDKKKIKELEIELNRFKTLFEDTMDQLKKCNKKLNQAQLDILRDATKLDKVFNWLPLSIKGKYDEHQLAEVLVDLGYLSSKQMQIVEVLKQEKEKEKEALKIIEKRKAKNNKQEKVEVKGQETVEERTEYTHKAGFINLFSDELDSSYCQQINLKFEMVELIDLIYRFKIEGSQINKVVSIFFLLNDNPIDLRVFKTTSSKGVKRQTKIDDIENALKKK